MFCSSCGKQIPDGSGFCPECGATQRGAAAQPSSYTTNTGNFAKMDSEWSAENSGAASQGKLHPMSIVGIILAGISLFFNPVLILSTVSAFLSVAGANKTPDNKAAKIISWVSRIWWVISLLLLSSRYC